MHSKNVHGWCDESPFHGITVLEARENIRLQKEEIRKLAIFIKSQI